MYNNGCDENDTTYPNLKFEITNSAETEVFFSNKNGAYSLSVSENDYTVTPLIENSSYFNTNSFTVSFPTDASPYNQDVCLVPNGIHNDLEIFLTPVDQARPGFEAVYKLVYKNKGTTTLSGDIVLGFQEDYLDYVLADVTPNRTASGNLSWDFSDLEPFESRELAITFNLNTPTDTEFPLNSDDILKFTSEINHSETEASPNDNVFELSQTVVNSYDPNDKVLLEGETITPEMVGDYVHYRIRFENEGTAEAVNIVVRDVINTAQFDISTLVPLDASHDFTTRISNGNEVEFVFKDIYLPFDDANNDGYVVFKIKIVSTLQEDDSFSNLAEIYFDFNEAIITNEFETTVTEDALSTRDVLEEDELVVLYPNPVSNTVYVESKIPIKNIEVCNLKGQIVQKIAYLNTVEKSKTIDVGNKLTRGVYILKVFTSNNTVNSIKFVKD